MIFKILEIIFPALLIALLGYFYAKKEKVSMEIPNKINLDVFIPILIFYAISEKLPSITTLTSFSFGAVIVVLGSGLILYPFTKFLKVNPRTFLPSMMFNNSINLGLPLALFTFGEEAMALFIALSIVQIIGQFTIAIVMYGGEVKLINLFKNPVIIVTIFGLFFNYFNFHLPQITQEPLLMLSQVSIPLILFSLGVRLASIKFSHIKIGIIGAILCPLSGILMAFFAIWIFDYTSLQKSLLILFGAMPPAVVNSLMAEKYGYDSASVASIVAIGNIFSLIIIPIVLFYLI